MDVSMGAKQSGPPARPAATGRTRAYSGSDLPSGAGGGARRLGCGASGGSAGGSGAAGGSGTRPQPPVNIPTGSPESGGSSPGEGGPEPRLMVGSLPAHLSPHLFGAFRCPVCSVPVSSDQMDQHLVLCLSRPRVTYNEDVLTRRGGECPICLEDLQPGHGIARLPCFCIYHKSCIDRWFGVRRSCPEHPSD